MCGLSLDLYTMEVGRVEAEELTFRPPARQMVTETLPPSIIDFIVKIIF